MTTIFGILAGVLILGIIMVLHELGHFLAGRALGFKIEQFSIFMGPVLFERVKNGVRYNIKAIPIGASVSFAGEDSVIEGEESDPDLDLNAPDLFMNKPRWQRAIVIAMGPFVNFISALIVFSFIFSFTGVVIPVADEPIPGSAIEQSEIQSGARILSINGANIKTTLDIGITQMVHEPGSPWTITYKNANGEVKTTVIEQEFDAPRPMLGILYQEDRGNFTIVEVDPAAYREEQGFMPGDRIIALEGIPFEDHTRVQALIARSEGVKLTAEVIRDGKRTRLEVSPLMISVRKPLGLTFKYSKHVGDALSQGIHYPMAIIRSTFRSLGMLFTGKLGVKESFAGPVGIVTVVADTVARGKTVGEVFTDILTMFGILSVAVGFTNMIPIPPLDGHHLLILAVEGIRRKSLSEKFRHVTSVIGLAFFIAVGLFVLWLDLSRLFGW
jgi:regulator of sigma E protease